MAKCHIKTSSAKQEVYRNKHIVYEHKLKSRFVENYFTKNSIVCEGISKWYEKT